MIHIYLLAAGAHHGPRAVGPERGSGRYGKGYVLAWCGKVTRNVGIEMGVDARGSKILMACPYGLFRQALARMIEQISKFTVVEAENAHGAREVFAAHDDIGIIMLCACDGDPEEQDLVTQVCEENPGTSIVLLAAKFDAARLVDCMNGGVDGYLVADMSPEALLHSLELVRHGERVFPSQLAAEFVTGSVTPASSETDGNGLLTPREQEIVGRLVQGDSNKAIANAFGLTEATVKMHLRLVFSKIGVANRTQAAAWALGNGFSQPN